MAVEMKYLWRERWKEGLTGCVKGTQQRDTVAVWHQNCRKLVHLELWAIIWDRAFAAR